MKVSKKQLRSIIREEKSRLLSEQGGWDEEQNVGPLISFAKAWTGLGGAVQEQVVAVIDAWNDGAHEPDWSNTVYQQNSAAIDMAVQKLGPFLRDLGEDGQTLWDALEEAQIVYKEGE